MPRKSSHRNRKHQAPAGNGPRQSAPEPIAWRQRLAYEAARIMDAEQISEFEHARRKAAERMGINNKRLWPDNEEIQQRLVEQRRLFGGESHRQAQRALLEQALAAMDLFAAFHPRLVGPALAGTATRQQGLDLQVFADSPEEIIWTLIDRHIPWSSNQGQFRYSGNRRVEHQMMHFLAGSMPVRILVLPDKARRDPPIDPVSNRPERGASRQDIENRLAGDPPSGDWPLGSPHDQPL